jgi:hypothetical protein
MKGLVRQFALVMSVFLMIGTNLLGGSTTSENNSNAMYTQFPTAFSPAPYTFAIWGPIFIGALAFAVYQAYPSRRHDKLLDALGWPMTVAFLANAASAYTPIGLSDIVLLIALGALIWAYLIVVRYQDADRGFYWCVRLPISIFFAWINVATILNISQWLVSIGFQGFGLAPAIWSASLILVATAIGFRVTTRYHDIAFALVLVWAFWGIVVAQAAAPAILLAASIGTIALLVALQQVLRAGRSASTESSGHL